MKKIDKTYAFIGKSKYLCIVLSLPEAPNGRRSGGHTYDKGVTVRFGFDAVRIWQFEQSCQKTKQRERLMRCIVYGRYWLRTTLLSAVGKAFIYLHRRGAFGVARFDNLGDARAFTAWNE
jgi:hypothetical protein